MSTIPTLAPHEMLELHEIINSEITCTRKLQASIGMVKDPDLKLFMDRSIQLKKATLNNYQDFYSKAEQH